VYSERGGVIDMRHTEVPAALEGRGVANELARAALDYAREKKLRVIPTCPFVRSYIRRHPQYADLTKGAGG
jgi:predicted GNAT family acetyltransferase